MSPKVSTMKEVQFMRRLAAILAADVVGYSAMMARDEAGTLLALKQHREDAFDPAVAQHRGRIIKLIGDGTLVEFTSAVDAVNCAVAIQQTAQPTKSTDQIEIILRIGINLGDVIVDGDDIYGNGVNIAARLEPLARPGGVCISSIVKDSMGGRSTVSFADGGKVQVKNIDHPIHVWHWHHEVVSTPDDVGRAPAPPQGTTKKTVVETASIAVLPFDNMSGDTEQEYFSDGITEDIITDLSKVSGLLVIARNSSFAYKGRSVDLRIVGRELGVGTVLEGSVRRSGNRVRISAQLIDADTGGHLWAERYDRDLTDIFEVQDEVTLSIVDALKVTLKPGEKDRITRAETTNVEAHDYIFRARSLITSPNLNAEMIVRAIEYCERVLELEPNYFRAYSEQAMAHLFNMQNRWSNDPEASIPIAREMAALAVKFGPDEPLAHQAQTLVAQMECDWELASASVNRALELDPNLAYSLMARGAAAIFKGHPEDSFDDLERAMRLDPGFSHQYLHFIGLAHYFLGNYQAAELMFRERLMLAKDTDNGRVLLAATLGQLGQPDEAQQVWRELKELHPEFSYKQRLAAQPYQDPSYEKHILDGLSKAGVKD